MSLFATVDWIHCRIFDMRCCKVDVQRWETCHARSKSPIASLHSVSSNLIRVAAEATLINNAGGLCATTSLTNAGTVERR